MFTNQERANHFAEALAKCYMMKPHDLSHVASHAMKHHIKLTKTQGESESSHRSDFMINMMHHVSQNHPGMTAVIGTSDTYEVTSNVIAILNNIVNTTPEKEVLNDQISALECVVRGFAQLLQQAGEVPSHYFRFKAYDFAEELHCDLEEESRKVANA